MRREQSESETDRRVTDRIRRTRERIEDLQTPDGEFVVACRESGVRPEPVDDARFGSFADAELACGLALRYRAAMRSIDPALTRYRLVPSSVDRGDVQVASVRETSDERRANGLPLARTTVTVAGRRNDEWLRVENGPIVHFTGTDSLLDDEVVARQLESKLGEHV